MSTSYTYDLELLRKSEQSWRSNAGLRAVYYEYFKLIRECAPEGKALEVGSGIGVLREVIPSVVTSDVAKTPYVDIAVSAYGVEESGRDWAAVYAMDVLHHLREPFRFLASASYALIDGGRVVLLEPAATVGGRLFYKMFHHEPIAPARLLSPYVFPADDADGSFANMGMGWALFQRDRSATEDLLAEMGLKIVQCRYLGGLSYPLTGGFSHKAFVSLTAAKLLLRLESFLPKFWWRIFGLRMLVVLEKSC